MDTPNLKCHLFICTSCTYKKANGEQSSPDEAKELRQKVKKEAVDLYGRSNVRVSAVNCLGTCDHGISSVMYPQNEWRLNLKAESAPNLLEWVKSKMTP